MYVCMHACNVCMYVCMYISSYSHQQAKLPAVFPLAPGALASRTLWQTWGRSGATARWSRCEAASPRKDCSMDFDLQKSLWIVDFNKTYKGLLYKVVPRFVC